MAVFFITLLIKNAILKCFITRLAQNLVNKNLTLLASIQIYYKDKVYSRWNLYQTSHIVKLIWKKNDVLIQLGRGRFNVFVYYRHRMHLPVPVPAHAGDGIGPGWGTSHLSRRAVHRSSWPSNIRASCW